MCVFSRRSAILTWYGVFIGMAIVAIGFPDRLVAASADDLIANASANRGVNVIRTAEIYFTAKIADAPPTQAEIDRKIENKRKAFQAILERSRDNPYLVRSLEGAIRNIVEEVTPQIIANAMRSISGVYLIGGPSPGGDRLVEFRIRRGSEPEWSHPMTLLFRHAGLGRQTSVHYDIDARTAVAGENGVTPGIDEPHILGRLQGLLLSYDKEASSWTLELDDEPQSGNSDGTVVNVFDTREGRKVLIARVAIDETRDFVCPLLEEYDEKGEILRSWRCKDYFRDQASGIWFPSTCRYTYAIPSRPGVFGTVDYEFDPAVTHFNRDYPVDRFSIEIPPGIGLIRDLRGEQNRWNAKCELVLTIDGLDSLSTHPCLAKVTVNTGPQAVPLTGKASPWRNAIIWANSLVLAAVIGFIVVRLIRKRASPCWLVAAIVATAASSGCSEAVPASPPSALETVSRDNALRVHPSKIDFGETAADGRLLKSVLELANNDAEHTLSVSLSSGCGCTTLGESNPIIQPGGKITIPVSVVTPSRSGNFSTSIQIQWSHESQPNACGTLIVPIAAHIVQWVFSQPSRAFLIPENTQTQSAIISISAPGEQWVGLEVVSSCKSFSISPIPRQSTLEDGNRRAFLVKAQIGADLHGASVLVREIGQDRPILMIPVLTGSREGKIAG